MLSPGTNTRARTSASFASASIAKTITSEAGVPRSVRSQGSMRMRARRTASRDFTATKRNGRPQETVSCGLPFLLVAVKSRDAVRRARIRMDPWDRTLRGTPASEVMVFAMDAAGPGADVRARVFVPGLSVPEDPATGSACAALGGYLALRTPRDEATLRWVVEQGVEMGRPSRIEIEVDKHGGRPTAVRVGGGSVLVAEGTLHV